AGYIHNIPFSALFDKDTNRPLLWNAAIVKAPSASLFVESSARAAHFRLDVLRSRVAVVSNPAFDRKRYSSLPELAAANNEAAALAKIYRNVQILAGRDATVNAVREAFTRNVIVHYAGHTLENENHPDFAALLLADGGGDGEFYARDIAALPTGAAQLVFSRSAVMVRGKAWQ